MYPFMRTLPPQVPTMRDMHPRRLQHGVPERDSSNLSLVRLIDQWSFIEAKSYPIKDGNALRRIRYEIKRFIYANILHRTRVNFLLFRTFYSYRYNYEVLYVGNQYAFDMCAGGSGDMYNVLKRHYAQGKASHERVDITSDLKDNYTTDVEICHRSTYNFSNDISIGGGASHPEEDSFLLGGTLGRDTLSPQLYTSIVACCLVLLERKCYLDFICLYLYMKAYFALESVSMRNGTILNFTCHEIFLNLLLLLSDLTASSSSNGRDRKDEGKLPYDHTHTEKRDLYSLMSFDKDMRIENLSRFSYNVLLLLRVKINFHELNYDLNTDVYSSLCNFVMSFRDAFTSRFVCRLNEINGLTRICGHHIWGRAQGGGSHMDKKNGMGTAFHMNSIIPIEQGCNEESSMWNSPSLTSGNYTALLPHMDDIPMHQNGGIFTHFKDRKGVSGGEYTLDNFSAPHLSAKEASYYNFSLFNSGEMTNSGENIWREVLSNTVDDDSPPALPRWGENSCHALTLKEADIYQEEELRKNESDVITTYQYITRNHAHKSKNDEGKYLLSNVKRGWESIPNGGITEADQSYLWHKSYTNDTCSLNAMEKNKKKKKYKAQFLSIINSIYVTLHKNVICSLHNRIEEYRFFSLKPFFHFLSRNELLCVEKEDLLSTYKNKIMACLLGHESEMFCSEHTFAGRVQREKRKWKDAPHVKKEKLNRLRRRKIYISKNFVCVNDGVAFWLDKKKEGVLRLRFVPFGNMFSSPFYQRYFHLFLFFARVGTLVRYVQAFVRVFSALLFREGVGNDSGANTSDNNSGGDSSSGANTSDNNSGDDSSCGRGELQGKSTSHPHRRRKKERNRLCHQEEDIIPMGEVFTTFINSVAKYLHWYSEQTRRVILHGNANTPMDIYNKVKRYTECIELLAFLCSSYTQEKEEVFRKKYFVFYNAPPSDVLPPDGTVNSNLNQVTEYNSLLNVIYGLSHNPREEGTNSRRYSKMHDDYQTRVICGNRVNLFIFPRGNELLSYVYRYYYLFLSSRRRHLAKVCKYIFLRILKPLLYFLYAYVFLGVNRDFHCEYIISKQIARQFFFVLHKGNRYYDRGKLLSDPCLSLPIFLKYAIGVVYRAGELSRILRSISEEDFQLAIPKNLSGKNWLAKKKKKKKMTQSDQHARGNVNQMGNAKDVDLPNLLCSLSTATLEHFFLLHANPSRKKLMSPGERFENIFIEHWNDEESAKHVFSRTRRNIRKRLHRYFHSFRSALSRPDSYRGSATTKRGDINLNKGNEDSDAKYADGVLENCVDRGNALSTCRLKKSLKLRIIAKRGKRVDGRRRCFMIRRDRGRLDRRDGNRKQQEEDSSDCSSDSTSFPLSDDTTASSHSGSKVYKEMPPNLYHVHCDVNNERPHRGKAHTPFSLTTNTPLDEVDNYEERRDLATFHINYEDDREQLSSAVKFGRRSYYRHSLTGRVAKWTKLVKPLGSDGENYLGVKDNPCDSLREHGTDRVLPMWSSEKMNIQSINYFLYKNLYTPIKEHYDNVNRILVWSFLLKHNFLAFVCLLKCRMFLETEEKHRVFSSLLSNRKGESNSSGSGILNGNNYDEYPYYDKRDDIGACTSEKTQSRRRQRKILHHRVDSHCYTATDICTKFSHIHIYIEIPYPLNIFFDEYIVGCYTNVYRLIALLYFTHQSLNGIFGTFRSFSKPLVYQYRKKDTDEGEGKGKGRERHFRSSDFKYMDVINSIARGNASSGDSDEEQKNQDQIDGGKRSVTPSLNCLLSRNTCNAHLTQERFISIGFDEHFMRHLGVHKFVNHIKIMSDLLKDLNKIRAEMDFIVRNIYEYIVNTNVVRSYFFFFKNVLKVRSFSSLIEFHKSLAEHLHHFSFLSNEFVSLYIIISNIVNLVHVFKRIMDSLTWINVEVQEPVNFLQTFQEHTKKLEHNIILLTSEEVQEFIRSFYANRNELLLYIREFRSGPLDCIYNKFFFNGFYARMFGEDEDD
ncbi:conserved Plasmodium protein, unknown function [Plasmodium knowlesi strain H]|uniref:Gamma tubulin complex component C-terminal domain-containing protein n=3 Tax=Plasmodium knowlesi TaxID=5850 RepID=A0A679L4J2_PLAKH|nr:conserved Plasmodium protein, unknown function [Plasmodium knowlesi strain H]OTN66027.1 Uncharacterized protein PKNOH_S100054400 [Plasmodium knowlesi]CAA9987902.1 conserved Plasmodium protein, unknown function [Plasmodium knowlesi strain H]SBO28835.1 conserved Plasmodium protein, unknown function [Plasmodium knowlesi strain H]VVS77376.1 conserved Plasmodium protein, unknown function [Plasmodium knowlesi strain H]